MMALAKLAAHAASPAPDAFDARNPRRAHAHARRAPAAAASDRRRPRRADDDGGGGDVQGADDVKRRAEGDLQVLRAQEELGLGPAPGGEDAAPVPPEELLTEVRSGKITRDSRTSSRPRLRHTNSRRRRPACVLCCSKARFC
jgi:hypothetical protein